MQSSDPNVTCSSQYPVDIISCEYIPLYLTGQRYCSVLPVSGKIRRRKSCSRMTLGGNVPVERTLQQCEGPKWLLDTTGSGVVVYSEFERLHTRKNPAQSRGHHGRQ
jgi:hypothetical protein